MKRFPQALLLPGSAGAILTGLFIASWVAYLWGDGDGERAVFCSAVAVFAVPMLVGSVQLLRRRRSGFRLFRFGLWLFVCEPRVRRMLLSLDRHPDFIEYMAGRSFDGQEGA